MRQQHAVAVCVENLLVDIEEAFYRAMSTLCRYESEPNKFLHQGALAAKVDTSTWTCETTVENIKKFVSELTGLVESLCGIRPPYDINDPVYAELLERSRAIRRPTHVFIELSYSPDTHLLASNICLISLNIIENARAA